jgi:hypothetical protein
MPTITTTRTTYTVRAAAHAPVKGDAGPLLDRVLEALEQDERAIAPVCGYDYDTGRVDATFQLELASPGRGLVSGTEEARRIFDAALHIAHVFVATSAISIVPGDDPDLLP